MTNNIQLFQYTETRAIRELTIKGEAWFVAQDVCEILELTDTSKSTSKLDEEDKLMRKLFVSGQHRDIILVNESGLYHLIFASNKPEAKKFKRWITKEVLPQIRKVGMYVAPNEEIEKIKQLRKNVKAYQTKFLADPEYLDWQEKKYTLKSWMNSKKRIVSSSINSLFEEEQEDINVEDVEFEDV